MFLTATEQHKVTSILEVGCGNSVWLPHLANTTGAVVAGVDYSEQGCELARQNLAVGKVNGHIFCKDIFQSGPDEIGQYDLVFSLGVVEHFTDLEGVLQVLLRFVKPGGMLLTEIPNMRSIHGLLSWVWQPDILRKHQLINKQELITAYQHIGMQNVHGRYIGIGSISIVAWEINSRWKLGSKMVPRVVRKVDRFMQRRALRYLRYYSGIAPFAPYICVTGLKPESS
jgi:SAM-dependent methyltransferase